MQKGLTLLVILTALMTGALVHPRDRHPAENPAAAEAKKYFRRDALAFSGSADRLRFAVRQMTASPANRITLLAALRDCRSRYKKIESLLSCFFPTVAAGLNGPPVYEGEEPFMEYQEPRGLQVIEAILADSSRPWDRSKLLQETELLAETAGSLPALMYDFHLSDADILQSIRLCTIRVTTLGITGYDAPVLKTGLAESAVVCESLAEELCGFPEAQELVHLAGAMSGFLKISASFDRFDRLRFLTSTVLPFQAALRNFCLANGYVLPAGGLLQKDITDIFSPGALRPASAFPTGEALRSLGRKWFSDKSLSGGNAKSCASCHDPEKAFSDGLPVSPGLDPRKPLKRNTPSLFYSGYQYREFWDGKSAGLESQIFAVLHDPLEMDIDTATVLRCWKQTPGYSERITAAFPGNPRPAPSRMIGLAIGAYVNTLGSFNSAFDRYLRGDSNAIDARAKNGFNLFMGKARCGSCHFAPLFNGTLPPDFDRTEFEVLGTTRDADFKHPVLSSDEGRYVVYPLPFNRYSFKTPTVRNAAQTAPYMHNGTFKTLESVLAFYNNGGGAGMGLHVPGQTLASDSLHLDEKEIKEIIAFIYALTDKPEPEKQ